MITKKELTGARLKRDLNLHKAHYFRHNRNKTGGNFRINLFYSDRTWGERYQLTGSYNNSGRIYKLKFGRWLQTGLRLRCLSDLTYHSLIIVIKRRIAEHRSMEATTRKAFGDPSPKKETDKL